MKNYLTIILIAIVLFGCAENPKKNTAEKKPETPFVWEGANLYFLLTDRFNNGDTSNDINFDRTKETGKLRGFEGGDLKGITQKIEEGYFNDLGVNAIWMTPIVEQIHGGTDEGTGVTYGFHGYWAKDWTAIDPNYGTADDLKKLVDTAHKRGIRVLLDAVINHTGPVTEEDPVWPDEWVRTSPQCDYTTYDSTITCTLVKNLPDIKTESNDNVELPPQLVEKWKAEGRFDQEVAELDAFFERTGHPRAPRFYIMKWLTDYITDFGIDGYRVDTVKHTEEFVWQEFKKECDFAFSKYKTDNPDKVMDDNEFYLVGEVYGYGISAGKAYDLGGTKINYFDNAFESLINFEFKWNALQQDNETLFSRYSTVLHNDLKDYGLLNYLASHDDGQPYDGNREKPYETATKLLLAPGTSQTYYGDESARSLVIEETVGDATLRSFMNWDDVKNNEETNKLLSHWQKLGQFRKNHPAIGAGVHEMISQSPYVFKRQYSNGNYSDKVVVGLDLPSGMKELDVSSVFNEGQKLRDAYSGMNATVTNGKINIDSKETIVLLEAIK
ncbi:alpha-amylase family glycosyl hydrolase [Subsaxibacter sp. CAU 1640]|uniref:alpha-amylase family glycosyl hydrolase n=1 Tax=Subsaxibacter sp. CAU 1640 TaxID=2933271 RepID=UPI0020045996|nr:alpha-amylase family glycosyl hydrolase [Subsaxibacter sp. CAU 1640]MCK7589046.1 alpha-amylase family glycosyl hydrolase [Subsaxibacter sp. CAU 1640]